MSRQDIAIVGAGVIGSAVAFALAREGHSVLLLDRAAPGVAGASFGNVGHIASELIEPLPSVRLLFGFWRELFALDGPLDIPLRRIGQFLPWGLHFARAAFRREINTGYLAPLVYPAASVFESWLLEIGRPELLRRNGHYEVWLDEKGSRRAGEQARAMDRLGIPTAPAPQDLLESLRAVAGASAAAGLWFSNTAHVIDPLEIVHSFATAAAMRGAEIRKADVRALRPHGEAIEVITDTETSIVEAAVVCAGAWSAPLLKPFGLRVPLEAANGYHIELPQHEPRIDAPVLYANEKVLVTPMSARLRCSGYMDFSGTNTAPDPRKSQRLRQKIQKLGYSCPDVGYSWMGPRPVLPDYLPAIGRAPGRAKLFYATGHQHIGLTIAPISAALIADLVAQREPRLPLDAFDLRRFGTP